MEIRTSKKFVSLLLAVCMTFTMLPVEVFAEDVVGSGIPLEYSDAPLTIDVNSITDTVVTLEFTVNQDATVYYLLQEASKDEPDIAALRLSASIELTAGTPVSVEVNDLLTGTDYMVYGVVVRKLLGEDIASGSDTKDEWVSTIVSKAFTLAASSRSDAPIVAATFLAGAIGANTQILNQSWKTDSTNGFAEPMASVDLSKIHYESDSIWLDSTATDGQWLEFAASSSEGLETFDLTSLTLGKYLDPSISFDFTLTGTKSGGTTVTKSFSWPSGTDLTKQFAGTDFDELTQLVKFRITLQNVSVETYNIEFREFTIANQTGSGNTPPILAGFSDITFQENEVNAAPRQIDADITVTDDDSADFDGGQVTVSYSGSSLAEDQLSVGNIGDISVTGSTVSHSGTVIGTMSGGINGSSLIIALNSDATPDRTSELLQAITYQNTSNEPTSHRTIALAVGDGDGGISLAIEAIISVSGQAESGVEFPALLQDASIDWVANLNDGFSVQGNGGATVTGDAVSIWIQNAGSVTASFRIAAAEQFAGGMFDLTDMTFDVLGSGNTYTVEIIGHKTNASTVTATITGDSKEALEAINLSSITEIVAFDFQITAPTLGTIDSVGLDSFTIANPAAAGDINTAPVIEDLTAITFFENEVNAAPRQIDTDIVVTDADSANFDGGQVTVSYSGLPLAEDQLSIGNIGNISLVGNTVQYSSTAIGSVSGGVNGGSLIVALNSDATPERTSELLRAITYQNTSNEPTSHRTIAITVGDGEGTSSPATAKISVSGQAESGVEFPPLLQDVSVDWADNLNNGFSVQGNGGATVTGNDISIWIDSRTASTASFGIAAAEQFAGGMFDLTSLTIDVFGSGSTYTVKIIGHKPDGSTVTATNAGDSKEVLSAIDLSGMKGIVSFDFEVTAPNATYVEYVGLDSFTISNLDMSNSPPTILGEPLVINIMEDTRSNVNLSGFTFNDIDDDTLTVMIAATTGTLTAMSDSGVTVTGSGTRTLTLAGTITAINTYLGTTTNIQYTGALNANGSGTEITIIANDGTVDSYPKIVSVNITAVNDAPDITTLPTAITVNENIASNVNLSSASFYDVDSNGNIITLTLSVDKGTLAASSGGGVTVSGSGTGILILAGSAPNIDAYLNTASNINYTGPVGLSGNGVATLTLIANDGGNTGLGGGLDITLGTVSINITETAPRVMGVTSTNADGIYGIGAVIKITVTFSKHITITGIPQLTLETGTVDRIINCTSGSGTNTLTFTYTVQASDSSDDLDYVSTSALSLNGGTIETASGTNAVLTLPDPSAPGSLSNQKDIMIKGIPPIVSSVAVPLTGTHKAGKKLIFSVIFTDTLNVATEGGTPSLPISIGSNIRQATYVPNIGTSMLNFEYTIQPGDLDTDGINLGSSLSLNGATIRDSVGNDAVLTLHSVGSTSGIRVDGIPPKLVSAKRIDDTNIMVTLSEPRGNLLGGGDGGFTVNLTGSTTTFPVSHIYMTGNLTNIMLAVPDISTARAYGVTVTYTQGWYGVIIDPAGNEMETDSVGVDVTPWELPTVLSVSSTPINVSYKAGDTIPIAVAFNTAVTVTGTPQLLLKTGTTNRNAVYTSGSGSTVLQFRYVVQPGDSSSDLDYVSTSALSLNGGTIRRSTLDAILTLPSPGSTGSLANSNINIDTNTPFVTGVSAPSEKTYITGETMSFAVYFNEMVGVSTVGGTPYLTITVGSNSHRAYYESGDGTKRLWFSYKVQPGDLDTDGIDVGATLSLDGGAIRDGVGNNAALELRDIESTKDVRVDAIAPTITGAEYTDDTHILVRLSEPCWNLGKANSGGFTVTKTGTTTNYAVSATKAWWGGTVMLTVADMREASSTGVTVTYEKGGNGTITDFAGNNLETDNVGKSVAAWTSVPSAPTEVTAMAGNGRATVSFTPPALDGGAAITQYTVTANPGGITTTGTASPITVTGLTNGIAYTFTVSATNSVGTGASSAASESVTPQAPVNSVPSAPTEVTATAGNGRATVSFTPPALDGGAAITQYTVTASPGGITATGTASPITVTGLTNGIAYTFTVSATNSVGTGASSAASDSVTPQAPATSEDDSDNQSWSGTTAITSPERKPIQPIMAMAPVIATAGTNGAASAGIADKTITDAIAKAQADAKAQGKTPNGATIAMNVAMPAGSTSLTATLTPNSLNSLVSAGVSQLIINGTQMSLGLDLNALKEIQRQSGSNTSFINITITPATGLSKEAISILGNRPVYNIDISYVKDGKTVNVSSLGNGTATLSIPYTPGKNEPLGHLFGVYVDAKGKAQRISDSVYDINSRSLLIPTGHLSVYGVGYAAPSAKFTDIGNHWGKEAIDYIVVRGLLTGTSETTFSPDTAMTRGMLVTALGRLAGIDAKAYTTNSFTDVKADSALRPYIEWAYKKGVMQGIGSQQFAPDQAITREEVAVIFSDYAKATGYKLPVTREVAAYADDSNIDSVYKTAVTAMQQAGIMMGGTYNRFNPKSNANRGEVSSMLHRYIKLIIAPATAQGWALNDAGQWLYYKDGKALTGWQIIDGVKYYFYDTGELQIGWVNDGNDWRFYSGNKALFGWWNIGSSAAQKTYYFTKDGLMVEGKWLQIDGKWYYFNADGSLAKSTKVGSFEVDENGVRKSK